MERLGYIGIGDMGGGIATHLTETGHDVTVFDLREEAVQALVEVGAKKAESMEDLVNRTDIILICVQNDRSVKGVILGEQGILAYAKPGQVIIVQSTVKPETILEVSEAAAACGVELLDAPVSGNYDDRRNGTLSVMVGGKDDVVERCMPVLRTIGGEKVIHLGPAGSGEVGKLCNNSVCITAIAERVEILKFGRTLGLDEKKLLELFRLGKAMCWPVIHSDHLDLQVKTFHAGPAALAAIGRKDLDDAKFAAQKKGEYLSLTSVSAEFVEHAFCDRAEYLAEN